MIRYASRHAPALRAAALRIAAAGYADAVARVCGDRPVSRYRQAMRELRDLARPDGLEDATWDAVTLWFLGRPLSCRRAEALLGDSLAALMDIGVLSSDEDDAARPTPTIRGDRCGLVPIGGLLCLVSRLKHERSAPGSNAAYLGPDTLELIDEALASPHASMLEVGCGPGIVGLLAQHAQPARRVVGADLCEEAVEIARVNAAMNGVSYDVRQGDLYEPAQGERFDLLLADPPCIAVPDDLAFPIYGRGGRHGDRLMRRLVADAPRHFTRGGRLFAVTELQCVPGGVPFFRWLRRWSRARTGRWVNVEVLAIRHLPPDYHKSLGDSVAVLPGGDPTAAIGSALARYAATHRLYFGYWIRLRCGYTPGADSCCTIRWCFGRATARSRVVACGSEPLPLPRAAALRDAVERIYGQETDRFDPAFRAFIEYAPTGRPLGDLARTIGDARDVPRLTTYFVGVATALGQLGLLQFDHTRRVS